MDLVPGLFDGFDPGPLTENPVRVHVALDVAQDALPDIEEKMRFDHVFEGTYVNRWAMWDARMEGFDHGSACEASLKVSPELGLEGHAPCLRMFLRMVLSAAAIRRGGLLLHGCAMARPDGRSALLFLGASGAGKTTMTTRLPGWTSLADDTVLVEVLDSGAYQVRGTPFYGTEQLERSGVAVPLEGVVFLNPGSPRLRVARVDAEDAFDQLIQRVMWFVDEGPLREQMVDLVVALANDVAGYHLHSSLTHRLEFCFDSEGVWSEVQSCS